MAFDARRLTILPDTLALCKLDKDALVPAWASSGTFRVHLAAALVNLPVPESPRRLWFAADACGEDVLLQEDGRDGYTLGFRPRHRTRRISNKVFEQLWKAALQLANANDASLPSFPRLAN